MLVVRGTCSIKVSHKPSFYDAPNRHFKPALKSILDEQLCSDLTIKVGSDKILANKCVLAVRSPIMKQLIENTDTIIVQEAKSSILKKLLIWIYSGDVEVPADIHDLIGLYFLAKDFDVSDLIWRCEEEIIMKVDVANVVSILTKYFKKEEEFLTDNELSVSNDDVTPKEESKKEETAEAIVPSKPKHLSENILNHCKSFYLQEFQEVLIATPNVETQIASVPGLMSQLFLHIHEQKTKKKKTKVRFSFAEEITTNSLVSGGRFDFTDSHSEVSSRHEV